MTNLFIVILNMSLTGAFVITVICLVRFFLRQSPKIISYCLWTAAGFRLIFPFSIESTFSLIPFDAQPIPPEIAMQHISYAYSSNVLQMWVAVSAFIWLAGAAVMLFYGVGSFVVLKYKLKHATNIEANIYEVEIIKTPFVFGIFSPKIYLPAYLASQQRNYIVLHEQTHIRRRDHIVKFVAYLVLCLHWFNPLAWLAFLLMNADMEMACDEYVLKKLGGKTETEKSYSRMLLSFATEQCIIGGSPLAFGSGDIGLRIRNVLKRKKQTRVGFWASLVLVVVLSTGFVTDRVGADAANYVAQPVSFSILCCD